MNKEDIKIGMKVIPFQKTAYGDNNLHDSIEWIKAETNEQNYLFVTEIGGFGDIVTLAYKENDTEDGDYFNSEDFVLLSEEEYQQSIINKAIIMLKSKGITPDVYEKLWEHINL